MTTTYPFNIRIAASQNENSRHAMHLGTDAGEPDIRLMTRPKDITHHFYLELKTKKGKLRSTQEQWNQEFDKFYASDNCKRDVAYGLIDAKYMVDKWIRSLYPINITNKEN